MKIRVCVVAGISPSRQSHVVLYGGRIGQAGFASTVLKLPYAAMFPEWFPAEERPVALSMLSEQEDTDHHCSGKAKADHLRCCVRAPCRASDPTKPIPVIFPCLAFANQPLLILLGDAPN